MKLFRHLNFVGTFLRFLPPEWHRFCWLQPLRHANCSLSQGGCVVSSSQPTSGSKPSPAPLTQLPEMGQTRWRVPHAYCPEPDEL